MTATTRTETIDLADNARTVLERRYLGKDASGKLTETPEELFRRVAHNVALAEANYGASTKEVDAIEQRFYALMTTFRFLPNSPTLGNAGRPLQQLAACFVLPIDDSMEGIFDALKHTALIHKSGGGTGFSFSSLRPAGDRVAATGGVASGPVSFMRVFDAATEAIKQGGTRRGANMAILSVYHPDIEAFIEAKADMVSLQNFNCSVAVDAAFMEAVENGSQYTLRNPRTGKAAGRRSAKKIYRRILENAWKNGDPGIVFIDRINGDNPTPQLGDIDATNPCGEQPLLPYESCNLGSLNLAKFVDLPKRRRNGTKVDPEAAFDWDGLAKTIPDCIRFLDDVIDQNDYPIAEIEQATKATRKVGLGVMGWADLLQALRLPYDSKEAVELAGKMMTFIQEHADKASEQLAEERGVFPAWEGSIYAGGSNGVSRGATRRLRNATRTTIAPTGTLSIIADCSGGIEPVFALAFMRQHHLDPKAPEKITQLPEVNKRFEAVAKAEGFHSKQLIEHLAGGASLSEWEGVPDWVRTVFVTSHDISPTWHVRMQAAFQRHTDNAVSKTINFSASATVEDVEKAYLLAYREGCKGITIYRDQSRAHQVLSHAAVRGPEQAEAQAAEQELGIAAEAPHGPYRRRLPDERPAITHKFRVGEQEGYITVGLFDDGRPGEVFITISKEGSTIRGLMDSVAVLTSLALQYGVPIEDLGKKFRGVHFEPAGLTNNKDLPSASSLVDYIFRWLERRFGAQSRTLSTPSGTSSESFDDVSTGLACPDCGSIVVFAEGCLTCRSCGYTKCG
ncbi:MAG: vitamin B12-dependent ribonucleotide reductase [Chloroflexi bacterium]|nr:vitamin B12-dependent ribonucleotide reductase [Chloroflexota bacterium]